MINFGLVAEGLADHIVIDNVLIGFFGEENINIKYLQPSVDESDRHLLNIGGGWTEVLNYCGLDDFQQAFQSNDYLIVQIDTDTCEEIGYEVSRRNTEGIELPVGELIEKIKEKIISKIDENFYTDYADKIIFAITVDSMECWLLPLFYNDSKKGKTVNCLGTLNQALIKLAGYTIDKKVPKYYREISENYNKKKILLDRYKHNPSFKVFIEDLLERNIVV